MRIAIKNKYFMRGLFIVEAYDIIHIFVYIFMCVCVCLRVLVFIYIYIYIYASYI